MANLNPIRVQVTKDDILNALTGDSHRCMIADALQRQLPKAKFIIVDIQTIRFTDPETQQRYFYITPPHPADALRKFDQGEEIQPFEFTMSRGFKEPARTRAAAAKIKPENKKAPHTRKQTLRKPKKYREFGLRKLEV